MRQLTSAVAVAIRCSILLSCVWCGICPPAPSARAVQAEAPSAIPTFHSIGVVWRPASAAEHNEAGVQFRARGETAWRQGHPLWYAGEGEYRGSLVELKAGVTYEIKLDNGVDMEGLSATTWSGSFPVRETVFVEDGDGPLNIMRSGTASGYILYTPAPDSSGTIDLQGASDYNIRIDAAYVIVRGFTLKNAAVNGIELGRNARNVVIEANDISGWGRVDERDGWGVNQDSAIFSRRSEVERLVIQGNRIHHPRSDANNWSEESYSTYGGRRAHPEGPQAIYLANSRGNHVIRYNEISSDEDHKYNDCIGGGANAASGFPGHNSDIYGNIIQDCWDDALEIEGHNQNVRVWGNYSNRTFMHIAARPIQDGPLYVWRNVADASRKQEDPERWDDDRRGYFIKAGKLNNLGGGRVYVYHNTMLQSSAPATLDLEKTIGSSKGLSGTMQNYVSRNNIFYVLRGGDSILLEKAQVGNDFDYDLYNGRLARLSAQEKNGVHDFPRYVAARLNRNTGLGNFALAPTSPGIDAALVIPNFSDSFAGAGPDIGAHEAGFADLHFGIKAYLAALPGATPAPNGTESIFIPLIEG